MLIPKRTTPVEALAPLTAPPYGGGQIQSAVQTRVDVKALCELAMQGLAPMFDRHTGLFCYRRVQMADGLIKEGVSHRYTAITLVGLAKAELEGMAPPMPIEPVLRRLVEDLSWVDGVGNLGLLLWACAAIAPSYIDKVCLSVEINGALQRYSDARDGMTTELAWFLTGLTHAVLAAQRYWSSFRKIAVQTYELLTANQRKGGFFGHLKTSRSFATQLRAHIGCFADQVYPIYAMTRYAQAFENETALMRAQACAAAICRVQGPKGQWWWHYNAEKSTVFEKYPVFSVHQDGMAPMALFAVSEAGQRGFTTEAYKGLRWIAGANELTCDLRDGSDLMIWRSIHHPQRSLRYLNGALGMLAPHFALKTTGICKSTVSAVRITLDGCCTHLPVVLRQAQDSRGDRWRSRSNQENSVT